MNEKKFWKLVEEIDWADVEKKVKRRRHRSVSQLEKKAKAMLEERLSEKEQLSMNKIFWRLREKLGERINAWEKFTGRHLPLSDDSFADLRSHIIGLGKEEYQATLKDPKLAFDRAPVKGRHRYMESFSYLMPGRFPYFGKHFPYAKAHSPTRAEKKRWAKDKV